MLKLRFTVLTRVILLAMLAGSTMLSCTRRHKLIEYEEIQLGTTGVGTKALVTSSQTLIDLSVDNHTGFGVYGYKSVTGKTPYRQFNNTIVTPSGKTNTTWSYSPKRYWDSDARASYQFAAYWPYFDDDNTCGTTYVSESNKELTINDVPNWQPELSGNDILVATKHGTHSEGGELAGNTVYLRFEHILANIVIRAYYVGVQQSHVNILDLKLNGASMLTTNGSADYVMPFSQADMAKGFDSNTIVTGNGSHTLLSQATDSPVTLTEDAFCDESLADPEYDVEDVCSWFVVPSTGWSGLTLDVKYSIGDITPSSAPSSIDASVSNPAITINAGTTLPHYKYIVTLKFNSASNGVVVQSIKVADWATKEIDTEVYNW